MHEVALAQKESPAGGFHLDTNGGSSGQEGDAATALKARVQGVSGHAGENAAIKELLFLTD